MKSLAASVVSLLLAATLTAAAPPADPPVLESPDASLTVDVALTDEGQPRYRVRDDGAPIVAPSPLGFTFENAPPMRDGFEVVDTATRSVDTAWTPVWGTQDRIVNCFNELTVELQETDAPQRQLTLVFRAYDDGVAFRYRWPEQPNLDSLRIASEDTHFRFTADHTSWWIPDDYDGYEWVYRRTPLSAIVDSAAALSYNSYLEEDEAGTPFAETSKQNDPGAVNTPVTMRSPEGNRYLSVHEAALTDYSSMTLQAAPDEPTTLRSTLVPWPSGVKVKAEAPHATPWRTIQIADSPAGLVESRLIANLNEPAKIEDTSWIEPMTYVGIWWGMHIGTYSWGQQGTHGATTERTKRYMDFAAENGIDAVLVEGWNTGWENWGEADAFSFTESYPDFDLKEVTEYGREKGVALIGHHETGGDVPGYERQLEDAFALYDSVGVPAVKTGYAGKIRPEGVHHHGQQMVNHYRRVVKVAAEHEIAINAHEPIKPTGLRRTWPNMMTREGVRGMEYNAWSSGNPPSHTLVLPFTRMLAGPLDYTPGIFNLTPEEIMPDNRVRTTLAKQLANEVILYSPVQMAADLVEHYEDNKAFEFLDHVPADWSESHVLHAGIGTHISIARRQDGNDEWYVGTTTNAEARSLDVPLHFLDEGTTYVAHVYEDAPSADYQDDPHAYRIRRGLVTSADTITAAMGRSGGQAVRLVPATKADRQQYDALQQ
jgi:alpha-glucosidase